MRTASSSARRPCRSCCLTCFAGTTRLAGDEVPAFWPMVRKASAYIVRSGPDDSAGSLGESTAAIRRSRSAASSRPYLLPLSLPTSRVNPALPSYLRETADAWNAAIESWLYITDTALSKRLGIEGYYLRIVPPEIDEHSPPKHRRLTLKSDPKNSDGVHISEVVSVDALCLVRFGLRRADDPRILNTLKAIDATLKVETPRGPCWHRYTGDATASTMTAGRLTAAMARPAAGPGRF